MSVVILALSRYTVPLLVNGAVAAALAIYAWRRRGAPAAHPFVVCTAIVAALSWAYAAQLSAPTLDAQLLWMRVRFPGMVAMPVAFFVLCLQYSNRGAWLTPRRRAVLVGSAVLALAIGFTNPWHGALLRGAHLVPVGPHSVVTFERGALFWIVSGWGFALTLAAIGVLLAEARHSRGVFRSQALALFLAVVLGFGANLVNVSRPPRLDLAPFAQTFMCLVMGFGLFRLRFLELVPVARSVLVDQMSEGVVVFDTGGRVVDMNPAAAAALGCDARASIGRAAGEVLQRLPHVPDGPEPARLEAALGERVHEISIAPLRAGGALRGRLLTLRDVTESRAARDAALAATRARGEFLARMSHEIRTPMNGVLGLAGLLLETPLTDEQHRYALGVRRSGQALLRIVNDILDFSKIDAGRLALEAVAFDLQELLADTLEMFGEEAAAKGIVLDSKLAPSAPRAVVGDPGRLRQVIVNLVGNALKFTDRGGVTVSVAGEDADGQDGDAVALRFEVADTGPGIDAATRQHLFRPFFQADGSTTRKRGGTGLGLAISRQLVELMQGAIGVTSTPGAGSTFWFTVRVRRYAGPLASPEPPSVAQRYQGRILVAEDNAVNQMAIVSLLEKRGCTVDVAADGREAVEALGRARYDLVLMDGHMPEMDGYAATRAIRERQGDGPRTPIVAMTADAMVGDRERSLAAGMDDHLTKPVRLAELAGVLDRFLVRVANDADDGAQSVTPGVLAEFRGAVGAAFGPVVERYLADLPHGVGAVRGAVDDGDAPRQREAAHALKGASSLLGAVRLSRLCQTLMGRAGTPEAAALARAIEEESGRVRAALAPHVSTGGTR